MTDVGMRTPLRAPFRECPACGDLNSVDDVACRGCRALIVVQTCAGCHGPLDEAQYGCHVCQNRMWARRKAAA